MDEAESRELERLDSAIIQATANLSLAQAWTRDLRVALRGLHQLHEHYQSKRSHPLTEFLPVLLRSSSTIRQKIVDLVIRGFKRSTAKAMRREKELEQVLKKLHHQRDAFLRAQTSSHPLPEPTR